MKLFIKCEEANHTCDKTQYGEASFWGKIKLNLHLVLCAACRKYSARNAKLTQVIRKSKHEYLADDQKKQMKERLEKEMSK
jgi:predicted anti-sigma-YlaC factor YlaD